MGLAKLQLAPAQGCLGSPPERGAPTDRQCGDAERQKARQVEEAGDQRIVHGDQPRQDQRGEQRRQEARSRAAEPRRGDDADLEQPGWMNQRR